jgi:hypothetical protein
VLAEGAGEVTVALEAGDQEFVGVVVLFKLLLLGWSELPIVADVAMFNHYGPQFLKPFSPPRFSTIV